MIHDEADPPYIAYNITVGCLVGLVISLAILFWWPLISYSFHYWKGSAYETPSYACHDVDITRPCGGG